MHAGDGTVASGDGPDAAGRRRAATIAAMPDARTSHPAGPGLGLGLDAGGTCTRWALADAGGVREQGQVAGLSGLQLMNDAGRAQVQSLLAEIADAAGPVGAVVAGITGLDAAQLPLLCGLVAAAFGIAPAAVRAMSDIELACHTAFAPGAGYVVYAGTGSIAAFVDETGALHRVGGRGVAIDDAGGGHWIAREALRQVWRAEDEAPGTWQASGLARHLFAQVGGADWADTRQWVYGATQAGGAQRGELGTLALAVAAAAAEADPAALALLQAAGSELARLARALVGRYGARPLALAGRVFDLHPAVEQALRGALPVGMDARRVTLPAHHAAARMAAARMPS